METDDDSHKERERETITKKVEKRQMENDTSRTKKNAKNQIKNKKLKARKFAKHERIGQKVNESNQV